MTEGKAYLEDGQVPRASQVRILARHLKGKAHDFELFNYCFPLDYRSKQRKKLYRR